MESELHWDAWNSLLNDIGLSPNEANELIEGEPPEPVDNERIRAYFRGRSDSVEKKKVAELIELYRGWREAAVCIAKEELVVDSNRETTLERMRHIVRNPEETDR
jgi:hypothetical protein